MDAVALRGKEGWIGQFSVMLGLSVLVAVMGLSADSAAVVIGAMLLAPLMVPVMAIAAAISMALPRHLLRAATIVAVASLASVLLAFVVAMVLPDGQLPGEVLSRTSPDLRDLLVALAAGAAGAYATVRTDVSSALPGVAVAVALVPPLAAVGLTLEGGRADLAEGAALLYVANLTAIVLVGVLVFLVTGFVPPRRLRQTGRRVLGAGIFVTAATVAVAVPLAFASVSAAHAGRQRERLHAAATNWLQGTGDDLDDLRRSDDLVRVRVSGPNPPPGTADLERAVRQIIGGSSAVEVRWTQTKAPPADGESGEVDGPGLDAQRRETAIADLVSSWLSGDQTAYDIDRLTVGDEEVRLDLTSADPPPPVDDLSDRLHDELGLAIPVVVNWTQRTTLFGGSEVDEPGTIESVRHQLELAAKDWAADRDGMVVTAVDYDGEKVTVELSGPEAADPFALQTALREIVGRTTPIDVWFTQRRLLVPPSPPTPTPQTSG
jgi:uncharacterized hydrophobic protein (TIGR00271 family)